MTTLLFPGRAARTRRLPPLAFSWRFIAALLLLIPGVRAGVVINKQGAITVSSGSVNISFQGMNLQSLTNTLTNEQNIAQPGAGWMELSMQQPTGQQLNVGTWAMHQDSNGNPQGVITANDSVRTVMATLGTDPDTNDVVLTFQGRSTQPGVQTLFFGLQGFDPTKGRFLIPAHAGIYFDQNAAAPLSMEYPTHWEAQFVVYETSQGGVLIYAQDPRPYFKRVQASRQYGTLDLGLEVFALGPWAKATSTPPIQWHIRAFKGSWQTAVDSYTNWSSTVMAKRIASPHPSWAKTIKAVITIIDPVSDYIDALAKKLNPAKTLLYLVNWRNDSYDVNYPDYTPGPSTAAATNVDLSTFGDEFYAAMKPVNGGLAAVVNGSCHAVSWEDGVLTLGFTSEFHKGRVSESKNRPIYEQVAAQLLGTPVAIRCIIAPKPAKALSKSPLVQHAVQNHGATIVSEDQES